MFWGLNLKANRKYSQKTSKSFHISQAALDVDASDNGPNQVFITCDNEKFLVCTLRKGQCEQVMLDYNFAEGDEISFQSKGNGNVSLTGYIVETDDDLDFLNGDEDLSEDEEENVQAQDLRAALNKKKEKNKVAATTAGEADSDDDDNDDEEEEDDEDEEEEDSVGAVATAGKEEEEGDEDDDDDEDEDDDDDDDDDDDEEEGGDDDNDDEDDEEDDEDSDDEDEEEAAEEQPKLKKAKLENHQQQKQNGVAQPDKKKNKDKQAQLQQQQKPSKPAGGERTIAGGIKIEDLRVGNGPEAKVNKRAQVFYEGRLKSNNKVFDSLKQGSGFKFSIGRGEVIKGWDLGVVGMKVGGKRRIICPPHMAYGARGSPPTVPPNSTLIFEVELKNIS